MKHRAPIIIASYTAQWAQRYREEEALIREVVPPHFALEHIGSTSVPGLAAKPIIDVVLGAGSLHEIEQVIPQLEQLGYEYIPRHESEIPARRFLAKPTVRPRHFHLHGVVRDGPLWQNYVLLRDRLRHDEHLAHRYAELKRELARKYGDDREGYTNGKTEFILQVTGRSSPS